MTHIIIKTSKAKVLYHRDQLVAEATSKKELVGYSDDHVETSSGKYVFRVMPVAMPMEVLNQIYDLGNVEGDADVSDVVRSLESDIAKIHEAIAAVVKAKPTVIGSTPSAQIGVDPALEGGDKTVTNELSVFVDTKIQDQPEGQIGLAPDDTTALLDAEIAPLEVAASDPEGNTTNTSNPVA